MTIELKELYALAQNAEAMLTALLTAPREVWVDKLRPREADYAAVFIGDAAKRAREGYRALWANPPEALGKPNQTLIKAFATEADAFLTANELSREFPGGYRGIATHLQPDKVWIAWKQYEKTGQLGMAYDGLVWLGAGRWAWFPKPWRMLDPVTN